MRLLRSPTCHKTFEIWTNIAASPLQREDLESSRKSIAQVGGWERRMDPLGSFLILSGVCCTRRLKGQESDGPCASHLIAKIWLLIFSTGTSLNISCLQKRA